MIADKKIQGSKNFDWKKEEKKNHDKLSHDFPS